MAMRKLVDPILGVPSPYGLLGGCVEVITTSDPHELNGTEFLAASCATARPWIDPCIDPTAPVVPKVFDRPGVCEFDPVTLYAGVTCSTFGLSYEEGQQRALDQLRMGEQRALEEFFMARLCDMAAGNDLTPATGAVGAAQGVAALEGWLAENYGGTGLIHVPAGAAALLGCCNIAIRDGDCPTSLMGNGFVFGGGYNANIGGAGCTQAPPGEVYIYATGPIRVRRDERHVVLNSEAESVRYSTNDRFALAETTAVVEVACCVAAAIRLSVCC